MKELPNLADAMLMPPDMGRLEPRELATHAPRVLLLYGSLRERSFSRFLTLEAERLLQYLGAETRVFDPRGLPLPDGAPARRAGRTATVDRSRSRERSSSSTVTV